MILRRRLKRIEEAITLVGKDVTGNDPFSYTYMGESTWSSIDGRLKSDAKFIRHMKTRIDDLEMTVRRLEKWHSDSTADKGPEVPLEATVRHPKADGVPKGSYSHRGTNPELRNPPVQHRGTTNSVTIEYVIQIPEDYPRKGDGEYWSRVYTNLDELTADFADVTVSSTILSRVRYTSTTEFEPIQTIDNPTATVL